MTMELFSAITSTKELLFNALVVAVVLGLGFLIWFVIAPMIGETTVRLIFGIVLAIALIAVLLWQFGVI